MAGADSFVRLEVGCTVSKQSGELEAVQHESGAAGVDVRRLERGEDLGEGDPDAAVVFGVQGQIVVGRWPAMGLEIAVVVAAVRLVLESGGGHFFPLGRMCRHS
jgi:hypothetical protein